MKYLYLKLGRGNRQLNYCIEDENIFGRPTVYIFFGNITTEQCKTLINLPKNELENMRKNDKSIPKYITLHQQIKPFIEAGETREVRFISIFENKVFIFEPDSEVKDMSKKEINDFCDDLRKKKIADEQYIEDIKKDIPKIMYIKNIYKFEKNVPYILRTLNVSQYYNRGTCREIVENEKNWGIIQAIKKILKENGDIIEKFSSQQLFNLLSPHQFETLVFLILTNANIFSPA